MGKQKYRDIEVPSENEKKTCLAACDTQLYSMIITNANYPTNVTFKYTPEFCFVVKKLIKSLESRRKSLSKSQPKLIELLEKLKVSTFFICKANKY